MGTEAANGCLGLAPLHAKEVTKSAGDTLKCAGKLIDVADIDGWFEVDADGEVVDI